MIVTVFSTLALTPLHLSITYSSIILPREHPIPPSSLPCAPLSPGRPFQTPAPAFPVLPIRRCQMTTQVQCPNMAKACVTCSHSRPHQARAQRSRRIITITTFTLDHPPKVNFSHIPIHSRTRTRATSVAAAPRRSPRRCCHPLPQTLTPVQTALLHQVQRCMTAVKTPSVESCPKQRRITSKRGSIATQTIPTRVWMRRSNFVWRRG